MAIYSNKNIVEWYPWLDQPYQDILDMYQYTKGHHALLFDSMYDNSVASLCYAISSWLLCSTPNGIKSCGICYNCQLMIAKTHPDFYVLKTERWNNSLNINTIFTVIKNIYNHSYQDTVKIIYLPNSELLTEQITNAMLKTIEEPPENTYFLLCCHNTFRLLSTFKSRCLYWKLPVPKESIGIDWLQQFTNYDVITICTALRLSAGYVLAAQQLLQYECWQKRLSLCKTLFSALMNKDMLLLLPLLNKGIDIQPLYWLLTFISDAIKWQHSITTHLINVDQHQIVIYLAKNWKAQILHIKWKQWLKYLQQRHTIKNIDCELLLANQLLNWEFDADNVYTSL